MFQEGDTSILSQHIHILTTQNIKSKITLLYLEVKNDIIAKIPIPNNHNGIPSSTTEQTSHIGLGYTYSR